VVFVLDVDEANGRLRQTSVVHEGGAVSQLVTSDAADVGHRSYLSRREASSVDNTTLSWTSAEVMGWLERSRLQHLRDWYLLYYSMYGNFPFPVIRIQL